MNRTLLRAAWVAAALAAAPLAAQTQSPGTVTAPGGPTPAVADTVGSHGAPTIDDVPGRPVGRVSETAPAPPAGSGAERFRADLASCSTLEPDARAGCRREMHAARAQGLYRN